LGRAGRRGGVLKISVLVPVRDDPAIDDLLVSLGAQRDAPDFEVIVAMDGSRREPRVPTALPARLLRLPARGPYAARNCAVAEATGDVLAFTDSDCVVPPDWISTAARLFRDEALCALQGASRAREETRLSRFIQREYERYVASHGANGFRQFCNTRNFAVRAALARRLPLPETLPRGGDGVYGRMLAAQGVPIRYAPNWWVAHRHPATRREEGRRAFAQGRDGARWAQVAGMDLFAGETGRTAEGPGASLLRLLPRRGAPRRAASLALLPVAAAFAAGSRILPEGPAYRCFSLFRRACHLSGRLWGAAGESG
jgi:glycosyl transferase family 2